MLPTMRRLATLLIVPLALAAVALTAGQPAADEVMRQMAASRPPSWIKWLGWSGDATRIAWRQGPPGTGNAPGKPVWIARLDPRGAIVDRHYRKTSIKKALEARGIRRRPPLLVEQVGPADALVRTRAGELYAVAVRGTPPTLLVMRRTDNGYKPLARKPVLGPASSVRVTAEEEPGGRLMAMVVHTGRDMRRQASLFIVPLQPRVKGGDPTATLPPPATPTTPPAGRAAPNKAGNGK